MSQPVQHQQRFELPCNHHSASPEEHIQDELVALYHRSDALLRELTVVRRRMDELHAAVGEEPRVESPYPLPDDQASACG